MSKYIIKLSTNDVWVADVLTSRTLVQANAKRFDSAKAARIRLTMERRSRAWPDAKIIEVRE